MKNLLTSELLAMVALEAMAVALVEDDLRLGFSEG
jgi:hypothetical protein